MKAWKLRVHGREALAVITAIAAAAGCGGNSGESTKGAGGSGAASSATSGSGGGGGSTSGSGGGGGSTSGSGGGGGSTSGSGGSGGSGGSSACPTPAQETIATHISLAVTWPATVGVTAGSGTVEIWTLATQMYNGDTITGTARPCGSTVPDLTATQVAGGMKIGNTLPDAIWDLASMPVSMITGTHTGFDVGNTITIDKSATVVGATMKTPLTDAWPMAYTGLMTADHDADGKDGITATSKSGAGYELPPTSLFMTAHADKLYLATRTVLSLSGKRDTCDTVSGTATIEKFDNHVVGCHIQNGGECTSADTNFIDSNRTIFMIGQATYKTVKLAANAKCADARAALP